MSTLLRMELRKNRLARIQEQDQCEDEPPRLGDAIQRWRSMMSSAEGLSEDQARPIMYGTPESVLLTWWRMASGKQNSRPLIENNPKKLYSRNCVRLSDLKAMEKAIHDRVSSACLHRNLDVAIKTMELQFDGACEVHHDQIH